MYVGMQAEDSSTEALARRRRVLLAAARKKRLEWIDSGPNHGHGHPTTGMYIYHE